MNKIDRMLAIVLELQRKGAQRAEDLAATFEISMRTIYRDIQALSEAGVPVVGMPGQGYTLVEGYFLPPISFTAEEAVALLLGADFIEQQFDDGYRDKANASRRKIEAILPAAVREEAERVRSGVRLLNVKGKAVIEPEIQALARIRSAIQQERRVRFHYVKNTTAPIQERQSLRDVDPYGLVFVGGAWTLIGYCHLRKEIRHFRLKRMSDVTLLDVQANRPSGFDLDAYKPVDDRHLIVRCFAGPLIADQIRASDYYYIDSMEQLPEGLVVTLRVRQVEEVVSWLLGWGANINVLEPDSLRQRLRKEILHMLNHY